MTAVDCEGGIYAALLDLRGAARRPVMRHRVTSATGDNAHGAAT
jgi:hypothetical protein